MERRYAGAAPRPGAGAREREAWDEINLLAEAMIAGSEADHLLSASEIDSLLGICRVDASASGAA